MSLTHELIELQEDLDELSDKLGWNNRAGFTVDYNLQVAGDVQISFKSYYNDIGEETMQKAREMFPDAEKINYYPPEGDRPGRLNILLYSPTEEAEESEDDE